MTKIVWIASYPKSGNTWLRAFFVNYLTNSQVPCSMSEVASFGYSDMSVTPYEKVTGKDVSGMSWQELSQYRNEAQKYIVDTHIEETGEASTSIPVKTHSSFRLPTGQVAINEKLTRNAIYVYRNPLDVAVSYAHHYGCTLDHAVNVACSDGHKISGGSGNDVVEQFVGPWAGHVASWLTAGRLPRLFIRYEDMTRDPHRAFRDVTEFLKMPDEPNRLNRAVEFSMLKNLQKQEAEEGFDEKPEQSEKFFRAGGYGGWRNVLSKKQADKIIQSNRKVMQKMGYIRENGSIAF